jgi:hypothetical protein
VARIGAILVLAVLAVAVPTVATAQDETVQPPTAFDVDGGSVTTPALIAGRTYRLEVGGTFQVITPNITFDHDAAYCFDDDASMPICQGDPSTSQTALFAGYEGSSASPFYELAGDAPPYASSHRYTIIFTAGQSKPLRLSVNTPELNYEYVGQLAVALYLQPQAGGGGSCMRSTQSACDDPDPLTAIPGLGETMVYAAPDNGEVVEAKGPTIPRKAKGLVLQGFEPDGVEPVYGVEPSLKNRADGVRLCYMLSVDAGYSFMTRQGAWVGGFRTCVDVVAQILAHCQSLKEKRGGNGPCGTPPSRAAAARCPATIVRHASRPKARMTCRRTGERFTVTVRPARKGVSLRKVLGKRPSLVIGSPVGGTPVGPDDRLEVTWRVRR